MIPVEAMPVVEILRRDVKRPRVLPTEDGGAMRWHGRCPMGLCCEATAIAPYTEGSFPAEYEAIKAFAGWWDNQKDAEAAVEEIWPS